MHRAATGVKRLSFNFHLQTAAHSIFGDLRNNAQMNPVASDNIGSTMKGE
jgi:hypothetical protein